MSNVDDRVNELLYRAKSCGLRLEFDDGAIIVNQAETNEPVVQRDVIEQLGRYLVHVHRLVELRAHGAVGHKRRGQKIWLPDYGEGVLTGGDTEGGLSVEVTNHQGSMTLTVPAAAVLIIVPDAPVAVDGAPTSEAPKKRGFLGF
jgi:hypothetical protein